MLGGSVLLTLMTLCMSVWVLVCGQWYLGVFSFCSVRSDCWCCDCRVKWLSSSVQSDIHTNVFPLFPLQGPLRYLTYKWKGCLYSYTDRPWSIREGRAQAEAKHQPFLHEALMALKRQETRSFRQIYTLTFEHWTTSRAMLLWNWGKRKGSRCMYVHTDRYRWIYRCGGDIFFT